MLRLPTGWPRTSLEILDDWAHWESRLAALDPGDLQEIQSAELTTPITFPRKVLCVGANYRSHIAEMGVATPPADTPPFFFLKPPTTTIVGPGAAVPLPPGPEPRFDWEAELAIVIGRRARSIHPGEARTVIAGYTVADDLSARGRFARAGASAPFDLDWVGQKAQDASCPIGPGVVPARYLPDIEQKTMTLAVNGVERQRTRLDDLIVGIDDLVAAASRLVTLEPGDLILTGTPAGVGLPRGEFLQPGDVITVQIEDVGSIEHVIAPPGNGGLG
ncbi:fumarylacetoacetate hydrolase family protein [Amnibacterium kyonggiense]